MAPVKEHAKPVTLRCPDCRMLCKANGRTFRLYVHPVWDGRMGGLVDCTGSNKEGQPWTR